MRPRHAWLVVAMAPWSWFLVRDVHPWLDAVALVWPVLGYGVAYVLLAWALLRRRPWPGTAAASWAVVTTVVVAAPWLPLGGDPVDRPISIAAANVEGAEDDAATVAAELLALRADIVVVTELSAQVGDVLRPRYASAAVRGAVGVYSRFPLGKASRATTRQRGLRVEVRTPHGRVALYAVHLPKPGLRSGSAQVSLTRHRRIVDDLADAVAGDRLPAAVVGDLNLVERGGGYRRLTAELDDALRADWSGPTSHRRRTRLLLARVDHILIPESWCSARSGLFDVTGSEHRGVAAVVGPCR